MNYSDLKRALSLLGVPPGTSLEGVKDAYRKRVKGAPPEKLIELNLAYRQIVDFCNRYPFSFSKEEFYRAFPEEALREGLYKHPLWEDL